MALRAADAKAETLTPKLTPWDQRVLSKLDVWEIGDGPRPVFRDAWEIARELDTVDVADVIRTLDGLVHFGYAYTRGIRGRRKRQWVRLGETWHSSKGKGLNE